MAGTAATRTALAVASLFGLLASAQAQSASTLPATPPTQRPIPFGSTPPPVTRAQRPTVTCDGGQIAVSAQDASLNTILHEISRCTGMKITGGVTDQRVFGSYGPARASIVLATLLDGTGSNMLLRETAEAAPAELILTPRNGGPTPPSPNLHTDDDVPDDDHRDDMAMRPPANLQPIRPARPVPPGTAQFNNVNGSPDNASPTASTYPTTDSVSADSLAQPTTTPSTNGIVDAPNPPTPGSATAAQLGSTTTNDGATTTPTPGTSSGTTPTSPNGVPTPEQIYQELQKLQQQNAPQQNTPQQSTPQ